MDWIEPTKRNFGFVLGKQPKKRTKSKVVPWRLCDLAM
jgi:hypothetical protein